MNATLPPAPQLKKIGGVPGRLLALRQGTEGLLDGLLNGGQP